MKRLAGDPLIEPDNFWVFGYASLMWRPGFDFAEVRPATLTGYRRDMCFLSIHYRGTPDVPGLVCGLMPDENGTPCQGLAYRIAPESIAAAVAYLDERELITDIYIPRHLDISFADGRHTPARIYIADVTHAQFVGHWSDDQKAEALVRGIGSAGRALDYVANVVTHLRELGIEDPHMSALLQKAQALDAAASSGAASSSVSASGS